jgi:LacI family transcriptional regulator
MSKITIKDIAKELGMSISTVSRALSDNYQISEATKKRVREYAEKFNYRPDPIATSLRDRKSRTVCVIVPEIANVYFSQAISGIDMYAQERGYNVFVYQSMENYEREVKGVDFGLDRRADGFIISMSSETQNFSHFEKLGQENIPTVFFDRIPFQINADQVVLDNFKGAYEGTQYLINRGKRNIAHIATYYNLNIAKERLHGYKACLNNNGIKVNDEMIKLISLDMEDAKTCITDLLQKNKVDGIIINSGRLTLNILSILKYSKIDIANIEIVAFTNESHPDLLSPEIIPIIQPTKEMGATAAKLLIDRLEARHKPSEYKRVVLNANLHKPTGK